MSQHAALTRLALVLMAAGLSLPTLATARSLDGAVVLSADAFVEVDRAAESVCEDVPEAVDATDPEIRAELRGELLAGGPVVVADVLRGEVLYLAGEEVIARSVMRRASELADVLGAPQPVARVVEGVGELDHTVEEDGATVLRAFRHSRCVDFGPTWQTTSCGVNCGAETHDEADGSRRTYFVNRSALVPRNKQCQWSDNPDDYCIDEVIDWCRVSTYADNQCTSTTQPAFVLNGFMCGQ